MQEITYKVKCSKGTYIRTLCEDIANKLGTVGFMKELKRTQVGDYKIDQAMKIGEVAEKINKNIITFEKFFEKKGTIVLNEKELKLLYNGVKLTTQQKDGIYKILNKDEKFQCVGVVEKQKLKRDIWVETCPFGTGYF